MDKHVILKSPFLTREKPRPDIYPERFEPFQLQEQFCGTLPLRSERPVAELLAERLAESGPTGAPPVFIP